MKSTRSSDTVVSFLGFCELGPAANHELIGRAVGQRGTGGSHRRISPCSRSPPYGCRHGSSTSHLGTPARDVDPAPIVFTFTVVGSLKTLEFLTWLGVDVPRWIQNELLHSDDVLTTSY